MNSDNPTLVLGILFVRFQLVISLSRTIITRKESTCLHTPLCTSTIWRLRRKLLSFPQDKSNSFKKTYSAMLQFVESLLQRMQTLHPLDISLRVLSGISKSISDKSENSEGVSQSSTFKLLLFSSFCKDNESNEF